MKDEQMIYKDIVRNLTLACILLASVQAVIAAEESIDTLIAQITSGAKTNSERAAKVLDGAMAITDQPKLCVRLLEKAIEFGLKSPITPSSSQTADKAIKLLMTAAPDRKDDWTLLAADTLNAKYRCTRGAQAKLKAAEELLNGLLAAAGIYEQRGQWTLAAERYRKANPIAVSLKDGSTDAIRGKLKIASKMAMLEQRVKRYAEVLKKEPDKIATRTMLIKALVVDLNDPAKAAEYLNEDVDETWRTYIPMACKPLDKLPEAGCKELGDWYRTVLAKSCSATAKPVMLARAIGYYQQFLTLHAKDDITAITVKASIISMQKQAQGTDAGFTAGSTIDLLRSVDVDKHAATGTWIMKSGALSVVDGSRMAKITLPWIPEGSYDLKVVFVRKSGREITLMLPVGSSATTFCIGLSSTPTLRGSGSGATHRGVRNLGRLTDNTTYVLQVKVIAKKDQASIRIGLDEKLALEWKGDPKTLSPYRSWALPDSRTLGLGSYSAAVDFKKATLKMTNGRAKKFVAKTPPKETPPRR
jgi:tetratricopeptide (TPR) repeat protein